MARYVTEIDDFGWAAPPVLPSNPPPGNLYNVLIAKLGSGLYGFTSGSGDHAGLVGDNPNTAWDDVDAYASCMVLNRDYSGLGGQAGLDVTTAHEFNHSIQYGYGALNGTNTPGLVLVEGSTPWMEDEVYDYANDNYNYLWPDFTLCMGQYPSSASPYSYWITFRGMVERYGSGVADGSEQVMQDFWEETSKNTGDNLTALNQKDFEALLGRPVPLNQETRKGHYTFNTPIGDMHESFIGRQFAGMMKKQMDKMVAGKEDTSMALLMDACPAKCRCGVY